MSNVQNLGNSQADASKNLMFVENKHYCVINDRGDMQFKMDMQNMSEKLIANESGNQPSLAPLMEIKETQDKGSAGSQLEFNDQNKSDNKGADNKAPSQNEYDSSIDERLPDTVTLLTTPDGGKLYLLGTAHFSIESQNDVSMIIQAVQPQIVVVELCKSRVGILQLDEDVMYRYTKKLTYQCIAQTVKEYGAYNGLLHILLLRVVARVAKQLGVAPGGEFRRAFEEAKKIPNCIIQLGDRPINITIQRALRSLSWWQAIRLGWHLINLKGNISKEDVEVCKERSLLDDMISKLKDEYPAIEKVFVEERDIYLTYSLQIACLPQCTPNGAMPARVVGIVGIGHTTGIIENWGKVKPSDIPPIMSVPPQSMSTKILKFTVKASLLSAVVYAGYKILPLPSGITLQSIRSSVEGLLKVSGAK